MFLLKHIVCVGCSYKSRAFTGCYWSGQDFLLCLPNPPHPPPSEKTQTLFLHLLCLSAWIQILGLIYLIEFISSWWKCRHFFCIYVGCSRRVIKCLDLCARHILALWKISACILVSRSRPPTCTATVELLCHQQTFVTSPTQPDLVSEWVILWSVEWVFTTH